MLKNINFATVEVIIELGPGTGAITKYILEQLPPNATLICFEINDSFYHQLLQINNPQLVVIKASAERMIEELNKLGIYNTKHIISSLPFTMLPDIVAKNILDVSYKFLENEGTFTQYQYSLTYYKKLKSVFKESISLEFEPLNFPPAFVYSCKKVV
ncbi:MAG: class I SAM-dependent methyltransferase [Polaribacter sp.]